MNLNFVDEALCETLGAYSLCLCVEINNDAVTEHGECDAANIVGRNRVPSVQSGSRFAGEYEKLRGSRASAPTDHILYVI